MADLSSVSDAELMAALPKTPETFAAQYGGAAQRASAQIGVDPKVLLGQWGHETGWGKSVIPGTHNLGNIKDPSGQGVVATDNSTGSKDAYVAYQSPEDFADHYANLIKTRYPGAVGAGNDVAKFTGGLKGYAEDPNYAAHVAAASNSVPAQAVTMQPQPSLQSMSDADILKAAGVQQAAPQPAQQTPAAPNPNDTTDKNFKPLGGFLTGVGDFAKGATRAIVHGMGAVGGMVAPNSDFTKQAQQAEAQMDATTQAEEAKYQALRTLQGGQGTDYARLAGRIAPSLAMPMSGGGVVPAALSAAAGGALQGAVDTGPGESYAQNMGLGAATGAGVAGAVGAGGKILKGATLSPNAQALVDQGVTLTPGQALGGVANQIEQKATSIPLLGDAIKSAQRASIKDMNVAAYKQVLAPLGAQAVKDAPTTASPNSIAAVRDAISSRYDALLPKMTWNMDQQFVQDMAGISQTVKSLPEDLQNEYRSQLQRNLFSQINQGQMSGTTFKDVESELTSSIKDWSGNNSTPFERRLADALGNTQQAMRDALVRSNPDDAAQLQPLNQAWKNFSVLRNAAQRVNNPENPIMPGQLQAAVKQGDKSVGKGNFGVNRNAPMQQLSDPSMAVLGQNYPDSGTVGRYALGALLGGGLHLASPTALPLAGAATAAYGTQVGRQAMLAALARRPDLARLLGGSMQQIAPQAGVASVPVLQGSGQNQ